MSAPNRHHLIRSLRANLYLLKRRRSLLSHLDTNLVHRQGQQDEQHSFWQSKYPTDDLVCRPEFLRISYLHTQVRSSEHGVAGSNPTGTENVQGCCAWLWLFTDLQIVNEARPSRPVRFQAQPQSRCADMEIRRDTMAARGFAFATKVTK